MKIENIIDLCTYREKCGGGWKAGEKRMSEELQQAIQNLIYRLRELGPIN
jgi:hypothetical protein